jgi:hypothetical protein
LGDTGRGQRKIRENTETEGIKMITFRKLHVHYGLRIG